MLIVAGQNLDRDAVLAERGDGAGGAVLGRIEKGDVAEQGQIRFRRRRRRRPARAAFLVGDGDDAKAVGVELARYLLRASRWEGSSAPSASSSLDSGGDGEDLFDRALADQDVLPSSCSHDDRQAAALEVEGISSILVKAARGVQLRAIPHARAPRRRAGFSGRSENGC